jgi:ATP-binding protein involved in chromosome partitioning
MPNFESQEDCLWFRYVIKQGKYRLFPKKLDRNAGSRTGRKNNSRPENRGEERMSESNVTESEIRDAIAGIPDPEIGRSLGELNMIKKIVVEGSDQVKIEIDLPTPAYPNHERISEAIQKTLSEKSLGNASVLFSSDVKGKNTGGGIGLKVKNIIAVGSGKGGVGKSTVAASLAYGLNSMGCNVGLLDADVYGPSIPHMVGATEKPSAIEETSASGETITRVQPIDAHGVKVISMGFFIDPDQAVIWRGPLLHRAITQFLKETNWGELDYLIIDMPPGTGDVCLTMSQSVGLAGAVVVCTPQQVALLDAIKAISMFKQVNIPVLGIVENMTGEIFGRGGAKKKAEEIGLPFLGEIPIEANIRIQGDAGKIADLFKEDSPARPYLIDVTQRIAMQIAKELLETPSMPTLEIL